jgi:hypothetical protein
MLSAPTSPASVLNDVDVAILGQLPHRLNIVRNRTPARLRETLVPVQRRSKVVDRDAREDAQRDSENRLVIVGDSPQVTVG